MSRRIVSAFSMLGAIGGTCAGSEALENVEIEYFNSSRTVAEVFLQMEPNRETIWRTANIAPVRPSFSQKRDVSYTEPILTNVYNCSDSTYKCVYGDHQVFAIPRKGVNATTTYIAAGSEFHVEKCFGAGTDHCQVALVSSDCQDRSGLDSCMTVSGGRSKSSHVGPVLYFIYNEDFGVVSYGSSNVPSEPGDKMQAMASKWVLHGDRGLLMAWP